MSAAHEIKDGIYVHLGRGLRKLARRYLHFKVNEFLKQKMALLEQLINEKIFKTKIL